MRNDFKLFNFLAYIITASKLQKIDISLKKITPFQFSYDIEDENGVIDDVMNYLFLGKLSEEDFEKAVKHNIIEETGELFYRNDNYKLVNVYVENSNGKLTYYYDSYYYDHYKLDITKYPIIKKYRLNAEIIKETKRVFKEASEFLNDISYSVDFYFGHVRYNVHFYALSLLRAFNELNKGQYDESLIRNFMVSDEEILFIAAMTDTKESFIHASFDFQIMNEDEVKLIKK